MIFKTPSCWFWIGRDGKPIRHKRPQIQINGRRMYVTRYLLGPKHQANHTCDNRACVRLDHLFDGTQSENIRDAMSKGRFYQLHIPKRRRRGPEHHWWRTNRGKA